MAKEPQRIEKLGNGLELRYPKTNPNGHPSYYIDGKRAPSVTTVIGGNLGWNKRILMAWQAKLFREGKDPDQVRDEACDIGTLVHTSIEHHIFGQSQMEIPDDTPVEHMAIMARGLKAYKTWETTHGVEFLESELAMGSKELGVAGTADGIAMVDGKVTLIDFKTSKQLNAEMIIQLGAYKAMIEETTDYKIEQVIVLHIQKGDLDSETERVHPYYFDAATVDDGLKTFKALVELHEINKNFGKLLRKMQKK